VLQWLRRHPLEPILLTLVAVMAVLPFTGSLSAEEQQKGLSGWSSYGQWFGFLGALFACMAFAVATRTLRLQQQQIREASEAAASTMLQLSQQTTALKDAAEINGLAALIQYCERYAHIDAGGESTQQLRELAAQAKDRIKLKLKLPRAGEPQ
jgi:hypothetical protein